MQGEIMKIIIFGATGGVGQQLITQSLEHNHEVTAFVRNKEKITQTHKNLRVIVGDIFQVEEVKKALENQDVVVSTLGNGDGLKKSNKLYLMTKSIVDAMKQVGLTKIIYTASQGIDDEIPGAVGKIITWFLRNPLKDHKQAVEYIRNNNLNAVIVRPSSLTNSQLTKDYRVAHDTIPSSQKPVSRADVAHLILTAIETDAYDGASIAISK